jgi:uncharacterized protein YjbI with pentapeptide repeats
MAFTTAVLVAATVFFTGWDLLDARGLKPERRVDSKTLFDLVKLSFGVVAGAGALVALVVAYRRQRVDEDGALRESTRLHTERFTTAVSQLGDESAAVRLGGVHALAGLADDAPTRALRQTCIDVLCAYLRLPYTAEADLAAGEAEARQTYLALREVRHTVIRLVRDHLRLPVRHQHSWQGHDLDFTDVTFDGGDFSRSVFSGGTVRFTGAVFPGSAISFAGARFSGGTVDFTGATVCGGALAFSGSEFSGGTADFSGSAISSGSVDFSGTVFSGCAVVFSGSAFSGGTVDFSGAAFAGGTADFSGASFSAGRVSFDGAAFSRGTVGFESAEFSGSRVGFNDAQFSGSTVRFDDVTFSGGRVTFTDTLFSAGLVGFEGAAFIGASVHFDHGRFSGGRVDFTNARGTAPTGLPPTSGPNVPPPEVTVPPGW